MATILNFPLERLPSKTPDDHYVEACTVSTGQTVLSEARRAVQRSILVLDIALFHLRRSVPEQMIGRFDRDIAAIEALLAAARLEAQKI